MAQYRTDRICFCSAMPGRAARNLQGYARIAAVAEFRTLGMERGFVESIRPE